MRYLNLLIVCASHMKVGSLIGRLIILQSMHVYLDLAGMFGLHGSPPVFLDVNILK
jgi:hypothetical protein